MYPSFIKKYLSSITKENILDLAKKYSIFLNPEEVNILYNTLHQENTLNLILTKKESLLLEKIKPHLRPNVYIQIEEIYNQYKNKFHL